jgi:uncharacterized protein (TIGR02246 family)
MRVYYLSFILLLAFAPWVFGGPATNQDERAIQALERRQEAAWNDHNARAYSQLFTADADTVNVLGWWWKSRDELERKLDKGFEFVFARSRLRVEDVTVRFLSADVAIAHVRWSMTGAASPDGSGGNVPQKGIQTQTLHKLAGGWLIAAFHNTNAVPERDFPASPSAGGNSH